MVPVLQSTPTLTPAAASLDLLASSVTSRTRKQRTPAVCLTANTANVECLAWEKHTASVTVDIQERRVTEVCVLFDVSSSINDHLCGQLTDFFK